MRYSFIESHRQVYRIETMCRVLKVSCSGYYSWRTRSVTAQVVSERVQSDRRLSVEIAEVFHRHQGRYGSPRIHAELRSLGKRHSRKRIARLMKQSSFIGRQTRLRMIRTTDSQHHEPIADNVLARQFVQTEPNRAKQSRTEYGVAILRMCIPNKVSHIWQ